MDPDCLAGRCVVVRISWSKLFLVSVFGPLSLQTLFLSFSDVLSGYSRIFIFSYSWMCIKAIMLIAFWNSMLCFCNLWTCSGLFVCFQLWDVPQSHGIGDVRFCILCSSCMRSGLFVRLQLIPCSSQQWCWWQFENVYWVLVKSFLWLFIRFQLFWSVYSIYDLGLCFTSYTLFLFSWDVILKYRYIEQQSVLKKNLYVCISLPAMINPCAASVQPRRNPVQSQQGMCRPFKALEALFEFVYMPLQ